MYMKDQAQPCLEGGEILSFLDFVGELRRACLCPTRLVTAEQAAASMNIDQAWVCFCSQHALPVPSEHGNVSWQKRECSKVFQDSE